MENIEQLDIGNSVPQNTAEIEKMERTLVEEEQVLDQQIKQIQEGLAQYRQQRQDLGQALNGFLQNAVLSPELEKIIARSEQLVVPSLDVSHQHDQNRRLRYEALQARREITEVLRKNLKVVNEQLIQVQTELVKVETLFQEVQAQQGSELDHISTTTSSKTNESSDSTPCETLNGDTRREQQRVKLETQVTLESEDNFFTTFSDNISEGGIFVNTIDLLPIGTTIELRFTLPNGREIQCQGIVRWLRELYNQNSDILSGMGIQFVKLPGDALTEIRQFFAEREPLFFDPDT